MSIRAIPITPANLERIMRELIAAGTDVMEAGFVCSPELWTRLRDALADARAVFPLADGMPAHNDLIADGAEYLGDGVYAIHDGRVHLIGNAYSRVNEIFLEPGVYGALRRFAQAKGYEPKPESQR